MKKMYICENFRLLFQSLEALQVRGQRSKVAANDDARAWPGGAPKAALPGFAGRPVGAERGHGRHADSFFLYPRINWPEPLLLGSSLTPLVANFSFLLGSDRGPPHPTAGAAAGRRNLSRYAAEARPARPTPFLWKTLLEKGRGTARQLAAGEVRLNKLVP